MYLNLIVLQEILGATIVHFRAGFPCNMTPITENIPLSMKRFHGLLTAGVTPENCHTLSAMELEAVARGSAACCHILHRDQDTALLLSAIWKEGLKRLSHCESSGSAADLDTARLRDAMWNVLALYRIAYGPDADVCGHSEDGKCDYLASVLTDEALGRYREGSFGATAEDQSLILHTGAELCCYVTAEDLEGEEILTFAAETASGWKRTMARTPAPWNPEQERRWMLMAEGLETCECITGPSDTALPHAAALTTPEGLASLCTILARRSNDSKALNDACNALAQKLTTPDRPLTASLLQGLSTLYLLTQGNIALNCA